MYTSKHAKYNTQNIISKFLVHRFTAALQTLILRHAHGRILDIGSGEGMVLGGISEKLQPATNQIVISDLDYKEVIDAQRNIHTSSPVVSNIKQLPFENDTFDLVICTEVLEHIDDYGAAMREIARVSKNVFIISVPREPLWRFLNMVRLSYLRDWGNTPGHLNHWSKRAISTEIAKYARVLDVISVLPWTIVVGTINRDS